LQNLELCLPIIPDVKDIHMEANMDLVYLAGIFLFFILTAAFGVGCARLGGTI